ncbi:hypothetical protein [Mycobacterium sp. IS-3022]|uniref:hypothetical protein n=1 Tax=Mycobacterium sp. IS-3022 TaxID=1772277 RepID=UPI00074173D4|nr:hypothetical protein [Mycobacterium sp. IS-3022]KUH93935.1 hypothetical protein AU188_07905 [Mycobacterium sp. IS-3022]
MSRKSTAFVKAPNGCKIIIDRASMTLSFEDIAKLNIFLASGEKASTPHLRKNMDRNQGHLQAMSTAELERELERRGVLETEGTDDE